MELARGTALLAGVVAGSTVAAIAAFAADGRAAPETAPPSTPQAAPSSSVFATPWPARLPCAVPLTLSLDRRITSDVIWSSEDGVTAMKFPPQPPGKPARLARTFPSDRLRRVAVDASPEIPRGLWLRVGCRGDAAVEWGRCGGDACSVTATYAVPRMYRAWRTQHWTTPTRAPAPYDDWPDVHYSRFKQRIAWLKAGDAAIERQSLRLTRDMAADLRDLLATACGRGRCAEPMHVAERRLRAFLADRDVRYVQREHSKAYDNWNTGWRWDVTAGGTTLIASCTDIAESPQVLCSLDVDVGAGLRVVFFPRNAVGATVHDVIVVDRPDWDEQQPLGTITFSETRPRGDAWLEIGGRALALQAAVR